MMAEINTNTENSQRRTGEVVPFPGGKIEADRKMILDFAKAVFKRCEGLDGWVALRAFEHATDKPALLDWVRFPTALVEKAHVAATRIGNRSAKAAAVFSPPVCLFKTNENAKASNVAAGPVISAELDERPTHSAASLEAILGEPTLIVASGGVWTAPDGTEHDKLHLYWRLSQPATTAEDLADLNLARKLATAIAGADATNNPVSHPIRWPGSWHTKTDRPRLCRIIGGDPEREISLSDALASLKAAAGPLADQSGRNGTEDRIGFKTPRAWSEESLMEVGRVLPNTDKGWPQWSKTGMAFFDASHGSPEGLEAFHLYSEKSEKYDPEGTKERWDHWHDYPPDDLSGGTLKYRMQQEIDPMWLPSWPDEGGAEAVSVFALGDDGPLDLFANGDPGRASDLPVNAVPPMLERFIKSEARRKGAPEAFVLISALTAIGAAIGADIRVQVRQHDDTWTEASILWGIVVADPGHVKSPVIRQAVQPLKKIDAGWLKTDQAKHNEWTAATKSRKQKGIDPGPEPRIRRLMVDDITGEKLIRVLRDNPRGVIQTPDEVVGVFKGFGQYKSGGGADREHFLRCFDGDSITADRVGSGTITAPRASLSLLGGTQPDRLRGLVKDLGADGLLQRAIIVLHDGRDREGLDEAPDREAISHYEETLQRLANAGGAFSDPVRFSREADKVLTAARRQIKLLGNVPGASPQLKGHIEKWGKLLPRISLILHVLRQMEGGGFDPHEQIQPSTVAMAVRLAALFLDHSLHFYTTYYAAEETASEARWIAEHLLAHPDVKVATRKYLGDVNKKYRGNEGFYLLTMAMAELENFGWCWVKEWSGGGAKSWCVDARIHERFAKMAERVKQERREKREKIQASGAARALLRDGMDASALPDQDVFG